jgi:glucose-6-phosphate-specific signal transduction histidine kinase
MVTPVRSPASRAVVLALSVLFCIVAAFGIATVLVLLAYVYGWAGAGLFAALVVGIAGSGLIAWRRSRA